MSPVYKDGNGSLLSFVCPACGDEKVLLVNANGSTLPRSLGLRRTLFEKHNVVDVHLTLLNGRCLSTFYVLGSTEQAAKKRVVETFLTISHTVCGLRERERERERESGDLEKKLVLVSSD